MTVTDVPVEVAAMAEQLAALPERWRSDELVAAATRVAWRAAARRQAQERLNAAQERLSEALSAEHPDVEAVAAAHAEVTRWRDVAGLLPDPGVPAADEALNEAWRELTAVLNGLQVPAPSYVRERSDYLHGLSPAARVSDPGPVMRPEDRAAAATYEALRGKVDGWITSRRSWAAARGTSEPLAHLASAAGVLEAAETLRVEVESFARLVREVDVSRARDGLVWRLPAGVVREVRLAAEADQRTGRDFEAEQAFHAAAPVSVPVESPFMGPRR